MMQYMLSIIVEHDIFCFIVTDKCSINANKLLTAKILAGGQISISPTEGLWQ